MTQQSLKGSAGEPPLLQQKNRLLPLCVSLLNLALVGSNCSPLRPLTHTHTHACKHAHSGIFMMEEQSPLLNIAVS